MNRIIAALIVFTVAMGTSTFASATQVNGYYKNNGTYVQPYNRSNPDGNQNNNWSTKGNTNPYTGQPGTKNPEPSNNFYQPQQRQNYNQNSQ